MMALPGFAKDKRGKSFQAEVQEIESLLKKKA